MPFSEFYKMYPSIKENMPVDKFKFAHAQALASSSSVFTELNVPAKKKIEFVSGLLALRDKAISQLNSVNFRIAESVPSLEYSIQECQEEIEQKDAEIIDFKAKLASISGDEEYQAMLERQSLLSKQEQLDEEVASLKEKRQNISNAKNELENPPKKGKKAKSKLSDDQKQQKIASYKMQLMDLKTQIQLKEDEQAENQRQLAALDELYPTPEILQARKNSYDSIISAYSQLDDEQSKYSVLSGISSKLEFDIQQLEQEIETYPSEPFDVSKYTPDEQLQYQQYSALFDALKYIDQHSNNGGVKSVVNRSAKIQIEKEMEEMADFPVVVAATNFLKRKDLIAQKEKTIKEKEENEKNVLVSRRKIEQLQKVTSQCSLDEAKKQSVDISAWIRRLNDKQNYLQIPKTIEKLEAEIILLRRTISSLSEKKAQITSLGNLQA